MKHQTKAARLSFLLHAALIGSAVMLNCHGGRTAYPFIIDFTVETAETIREKPAAPPSAPDLPARKPTAPAGPVSSGKNTPAAPRQAENTARPSGQTREKTAEPGSPPPPATEQTPAQATLPAAAPADSGKDAPGMQQGIAAAASAGDEEMRYLRENFDRIRDLILRNLTFPAAARKLGWTGKVVVSFIIREDGGVEDITVLAGSGHAVLDSNIIAAIRRTAPFPEPQGTARLILPIVYSLK